MRAAAAVGATAILILVTEMWACAARRALRKLRRSQPAGSRYLFITERGAPMTRNGFYKLLEKAAARAGIDDVHPHLLQRGTGVKLVNDGMDSIELAAHVGHANIENTKGYAKMDARRFDGLWPD